MGPCVSPSTPHHWIPGVLGPVCPFNNFGTSVLLNVSCSDLCWRSASRQRTPVSGPVVSSSLLFRPLRFRIFFSSLVSGLFSTFVSSLFCFPLLFPVHLAGVAFSSSMKKMFWSSREQDRQSSALFTPGSVLGSSSVCASQCLAVL